MSKIYYAQDFKESSAANELLNYLKGLSDDYCVFCRASLGKSHDFIVIRNDGIHYVSYTHFDKKLKSAPKFGAWIFEDGSQAQNCHADTIYASNQLAATLKENVSQIVDANETELVEKINDFVQDLRVFPVSIVYQQSLGARIDSPTWGKVFTTLGKFRDTYFINSPIWQHDRKEQTLKISQPEVERIARLTGYVARGIDSGTSIPIQPRRIPDNYQFGSEVSGNKFYGRKQEIVELQDFIKSGKTVAVFGLQRVGKTSLIREAFARTYPDIASRPIFIEINLQSLPISSPDINEFYENLIQAIVFSLYSQTDRSSKSLAELQKEIVDYLQNNNTNLSKNLALQKFLKTIVSHFGKKVVIFIDELQVLGEASKNDEQKKGIYQYFIRSLGNTAKDENIQFLFCGRFSVLNYNETYEWELLKLCKKIELTFLDETSSKELISTPTKGYLNWDDTAMKELFCFTGGHPYFIQYICSALVSYANNKPASRIMKQDISEVIAEMINSNVEQNQIRLLYSDFESFGTTAVHEVLENISKAGGRDVVESSVLGSVGDMAVKARVLDNLVRAGLICKKSRGVYTLNVLLLKEYFTKRGGLPIAPESVDPEKVLADTESLLQRIVIQTLKNVFGDNEAGWWVKGVPLIIRKRVSSAREEDSKRLSYEAHFFVLEYKEIIEKNWDHFKGLLQREPNKSKEENLKWLLKFNELRKTPAHQSRKNVGGPLTTDEAKFALEQFAFLKNVSQKVNEKTPSIDGDDTTKG